MTLYQQIRDCAGSKMLRQAELVIASENSDIENWKANYPHLKEEIPMTRMTHEQVVSINDSEIKNLHYTYAYMLQTICYSDEALTMPLITPVTHLSPMKTKEQIINRKLSMFPPEGWLHLHPNVSNMHAFEYFYIGWYNDTGYLVEF